VSWSESQASSKAICVARIVSGSNVGHGPVIKRPRVPDHRSAFVDMASPRPPRPHPRSFLRRRSGSFEHPHDTPPQPFMPSPTFPNSSQTLPLSDWMQSLTDTTNDCALTGLRVLKCGTGCRRGSVRNSGKSTTFLIKPSGSQSAGPFLALFAFARVVSRVETLGR
jgi:hypothetical protein